MVLLLFLTESQIAWEAEMANIRIAAGATAFRLN